MYSHFKTSEALHELLIYAEEGSVYSGSVKELGSPRKAVVAFSLPALAWSAIESTPEWNAVRRMIEAHRRQA